MQNTISESAKIAVTVSNSFKDFDLVVTAFCEPVGDRRRKGI